MGAVCATCSPASCRKQSRITPDKRQAANPCRSVAATCGLKARLELFLDVCGRVSIPAARHRQKAADAPATPAERLPGRFDQQHGIPCPRPDCRAEPARIVDRSRTETCSLSSCCRTFCTSPRPQDFWNKLLDQLRGGSRSGGPADAWSLAGLAIRKRVAGSLRQDAWKAPKVWSTNGIAGGQGLRFERSRDPQSRTRRTPARGLECQPAAAA